MKNHKTLTRNKLYGTIRNRSGSQRNTQTDKNPTELNTKHTEKPDKSKLETRQARTQKNNIPQNEDEPDETKDEAYFRTQFIDKILYTTLPLIRRELQESPNFLVRLQIVMHAAAQEEIEVIIANLDLLTGPREREDILEEHDTEIKSKENTNTIKKQIIGPMNWIIERVNKIRWP